MDVKDIKKGAFKRSYKSLEDKIYRWPGIILAKLFLYTPITANQVTVLGALVLYISAAFFAFGRFWYSIIAILLLYLGEVLDYTDGNVARARKNVTILQSMFIRITTISSIIRSIIMMKEYFYLVPIVTLLN